MDVKNIIKWFSSVGFCFHNYKSIKVGQFPLVSKYCNKCGKIKFGNCMYYDGSMYQKTYKGNEAINFIEGYIDQLKGRERGFKHIKKEFGIDYENTVEEYLFRSDYETIEGYEEILSNIKQVTPIKTS